MGLPLYVPPVESDVRHKTSSQPGAQVRSRPRGPHRNTEFLRETRRRAILAATAAVRNRRDALDTTYAAAVDASRRPSLGRTEREERAWLPPGTESHRPSAFDPDSDLRVFRSAIAHANDALPSGASRNIHGTDNLPAARSNTAFPVTARDHFGRRRPLDRALDAARYNPYSEHDTDNLLALFSEHWASIGPGIDSLPGSTDEGAPAHRSGGGGPVPAHSFGTDGTAEEGLSPFGTESDMDGNATSTRASRPPHRRWQRHASSLPLGRAYSNSGRPTVGWSDNQERPRSRSPVSSSRIFGNMSHLRGAEVIYPEERTRHTARAERYRTNLLNRATRRSARNSPRAADTTADTHRSGNYRNSASTAGAASADANPGTGASSQPNLPPFRYIFGPSAYFDGLGDRQRSLSPEGDGVWDTLQTTVTPDPQPPSVGSSFASFPSGGAAVENNGGHDDEDVDFTMTATEPATHEPAQGADDGEDEDTLTLDAPLVAQTWPTTEAAAEGSGTRVGAGGALPSPGATSASTSGSRRPGPAYAARTYTGLQEADIADDADCIEGSEADDRRRSERRTEPVRHGEMEMDSAPTSEEADAGLLDFLRGPRHPWREPDLAAVIRSGLSQPLLGGRPGYDGPDGSAISASTLTPTADSPTMSVMQQFVRNLSQRQDIPDDWWAEVGLSRTLPED